MTHLKTHSGEKSNKCNQCDFACKGAESLRRHLKTHSGYIWFYNIWYIQPSRQSCLTFDYNNIWYLIITIFHPFNSLDWRQSSLRWYHSLPLDRLRPPVFLTWRKKAFCKIANFDFVHLFCANFDCYFLAHLTFCKFCNNDWRQGSLCCWYHFLPRNRLTLPNCG